MPEECRHRSYESDKSFSSIKIEMRVGRDFVSPLFLGALLPLSLVVVFQPSLLFCLKIPKMIVLIHGGSRESLSSLVPSPVLFESIFSLGLCRNHMSDLFQAQKFAFVRHVVFHHRQWPDQRAHKNPPAFYIAC